MNARARPLHAEQLVPFDVDSYNARMWQVAVATLARRGFDATTRFRFLDAGGGNGRFADRTLESFPRAQGVVLDRSPELLARNQPHPRKSVLCRHIEDGIEGPFDVVFTNWLLHHMVVGGFGATNDLQTATLRTLAQALAPGGTLVVMENVLSGQISDELTSALIYRITRSVVLAPLVSRLGANTAGVGVCFRGNRAWRGVFAEVGLRVVGEHHFSPWRLNRAKAALLSLRSIGYHLYLLELKQANGHAPSTDLLHPAGSSPLARATSPRLRGEDHAFGVASRAQHLRTLHRVHSLV